MFKFFSQTRQAFGLDISDDSLKVMQIIGQGKEAKVRAYANIAIPKGMIINGLIIDNKGFNYLLKKTLDRPDFGHINTNYAVASLPEGKSFVRVIQIPEMSERDAENAIPFEAENFIPLPIDQVYLDWQPIGAQDGKMNILIVASPKEFVDKYLDALEKANLKITALEVESQSCIRALIGAQKNETMLIVDLDAYRTSLIMVEEGNLQFTSTIPIAGNTFTESIARLLGISSSKAEIIKKKVGIANVIEYPNIKTALLPVLNNLTSEIKNILKFHNEHSDKQVTKILLCGGSAKLKNLVEFLSLQFADFPELKVYLGDPWQNLPGLKDFSLSSLEALSYTTAIGLAMRGSNWKS